MNKTVGIFICLLITLCKFTETKAQNDSSEINHPSESFTTVTPKIGFGIHHYSNIEIGVANHYFSNKPFNINSGSYYTSVVFQQSSWKSGLDVYGFNVGMQTSLAFLIVGVEWKMLFYKNQYLEYQYFSPKIGLSYHGIFNIEYLFNVDHRYNEFPINYRHQFLLSISLNKKLYHEFLKK